MTIEHLRCYDSVAFRIFLMDERQKDLDRRSPTTDAASTRTNIDEDYDGWLIAQASALRACRYPSLDWDGLAEELEDMAALRRDSLQSNLTVLLGHMLKLAFET